MTDPRTEPDLDARVARAQGWVLSDDGRDWVMRDAPNLMSKRIHPVARYHPSRDPAQALAFLREACNNADVQDRLTEILGRRYSTIYLLLSKDFAERICEAVLAAVEHSDDN